MFLFDVVCLVVASRRCRVAKSRKTEREYIDKEQEKSAAKGKGVNCQVIPRLHEHA